MIKYLRNNIGIPATKGIIPYGMPSFNEKRETGYNYNPKKARQLLEDAGYGSTNKPEIIINTSSDHVDMCEFIQKQLSEIGIDAKVDVKAAVTLRQLVAKSKLNVFRKNWVADYPDAESFLALFYSDNFTPKGPNYCQFYNEEFDWLYKKSQLETVDSIRHQYYREMDSIIISEAPIVPLYYDQVIRLVQNNITGLNRNPMNLLTLKTVKKGKH
jgi:peptide/nickel transport system substrate-binding protein